MQFQTLKALAGAARYLVRTPRPELAELEAWWQSPVDEDAARRVESRLFFEPALLSAARQQQRRQPRRAGRVFASLLVLALACGAVPGPVHADDGGSTGGQTQSAAASGFSLWDWLIEVLSGGSDVREDPGGDVDP